MENPFLKKYRDADLVLQTRAGNLFWMSVIFSIGMGLLGIITFMDANPFVRIVALTNSFAFIAALLFLRAGRYRTGSVFVSLVLLVSVSLIALSNRTGFLEGDLYQTGIFFILMFTVVNTFSFTPLLSIIIGFVGLGLMAGIAMLPIDETMRALTVADINLEANPFSVTLLFIFCVLISIFNLMQQNRMFVRMQASMETIAAQNATLEEKVWERTSSIKNILDSSGQGFLTFGSDFLVDPEYSRGCITIFGKDIAGFSAVDLLYPIGGDASDDFKSGLSLYFSGKAKPEVIFDLLEKETYVDGKYLDIGYREASPGRILCILTDVTATLKLEQKNREEEEREALVFRVLNNRLFFAAFMEEAETIFTLLEGFLENEPGRDEKEALLRRLHTFKGNAGFFNFSTTQEMANDFEYAISDSLILSSDIPIQDLYSDLKRTYEQEFSLLSQTMGEDLVSELGGVTLPRKHYEAIYSHIRRYYPDDQVLVSNIGKYDRVSMKELFARMPWLAERCAERLGKKLKPMIFEAADYKVSLRQFSSVAEACVHLINNMVDHGIEAPWEREKAGKSAEGQLSLCITAHGGFLRIVFEDDGRGIDTAGVRKTAETRGLIPADISISENELLELLFTDGFSTRDSVSELSGRGVGLSAVREEVEKLGGTVRITTKAGAGTSFILSFPLKSRLKSGNTIPEPARSAE